jgi:NitT/TauT family transport system substrate-binding protein
MRYEAARVTGRRSRRPVLVAGALLLALACAPAQRAPATGGGAPEAKPAAAAPPAAPAGQVESVRLLLDFQPNTATHTPFFVARDKGYYAEAGLDVEITPGTGSFDTVKIVGAGRAPIGLADAGSVTLGVAQDIPVTMVAVLYQKTAVTIFSPKERNISTPKQLEGHTLGVAAGTAEAKVFPAFATKNGLDLGAIKVVDLSMSTRVPSLINGNVDALGAFITEQQVIAPQTPSGLNAIKVADYGVESYGNGLVVNNDFAAKNPAVVERFVQATLRGLEFMLQPQNRDEAIEITLQAVPTANRDAAMERLALIGPFFESDATKRNGLGWMEDAVWKSTQDLMVQYGGQTRAVELNKLYTTKYLRPAGGAAR